MTRLEYVDALRVALNGLPPEVVARIISDVENRFARGLARGKTEAEIADDLEHPNVVAEKARKGDTSPIGYGQRSNGDLARAAFAGFGLLILDAILVIPGFVYIMMLLIGYLLSFGLYTGGVVVTAAGLAGVEELSMGHAFRGADIRISGLGDVNDDVSVAVDDRGVHVHGKNRNGENRDADIVLKHDGLVVTDANHNGGKGPAVDILVGNDAKDAVDAIKNKDPVKIDLKQNNKTNAARVMEGLGLVLGGIGCLLICLVMSWYTAILLGKFAVAQVNILRNA